MEDIDYLKSNELKESYIFYVDSSKRDKYIYPKSNHYVVKFDTPFRMVYSLEVLDASIPRTHYVVDTYNNTLVYNILGTEKTIHMDIGNYNDVSFVDTLNGSLENMNIEFLSTPSDKLRKFLFTSQYPFELNMNKSTMKTILGFNEPVNNSFLFNSKDDSKHYVNNNIEYSLEESSYYTFSVTNLEILLQSFVATNSGTLSSLSFNLVNQINETYQIKIMFLQWNGSTFNTIGQHITTIIPNKTIVVLSLNTPIHVTQNETYYIQINVHNTPVNNESVHFNIGVHLIEDSNYLMIRNNSETINPDTNKENFNAINHEINGQKVGDLLFNTTSNNIGMNMNLNVLSPRFSLEPPGIYNLTGDQYVILRCKEIENVMYPSLSLDKWNLGLAKFKLSVLGYQEERFDYNRLPQREFHPLDRLDYLTFEFQKPDGTLYDFKGVDHTITFMIHYYRPLMNYKERANEPSKLNPHYNPNFMEYMLMNQRENEKRIQDENFQFDAYDGNNLKNLK
jgi:hypothetical protein